MQTLQTVQTQRKYYLDIARAIAIISISFNHAVNRSYANYSGQMAEFYDIALWSTMFKTVITVFSRIGVPLFMMITGVLILNKKMENGDDLKKFYKHNLLSLLITTEIWYVLIYWFLVLSGSQPVLENRGVFGAVLGMFETMLFQNQVTFDSLWYMPVILCLYTTLPFVIMAKDKLSRSKFSWLFLLPVVVVFLNNMVMPSVNDFLRLHGLPTYTSALYMSDLISYFYLYILAGYFVGQGVLGKWKTWVVAGAAVGTFLLCCGYQMYMYAQERNGLIDYYFPLLPVCAGMLLELLRRGADRLRRLERPVTYLSRMAFGVYFTHIVIMTVVNSDKVDALLHYAAWEPALKTLFLEAVSVGVSIILIALLSKIKVLKKYLFMIK